MTERSGTGRSSPALRSFAAAELPGCDQWLDPDVHSLPCPDCDRMVTVRSFLMAASCWQCGADLELWRRRLSEKPSATDPTLPVPVSPRAESPAAEPIGRLTPPAVPSIGSTLRMRRLSDRLPAALYSLLFHLLLLLALALATNRMRPTRPHLDLAITLGNAPERRAVVHVDRFTATGSGQKDVEGERWGGVHPAVGAITSVVPHVAASSPAGRMLAARDARIRNAIVEHEGGTAQTEAAVTRGLQWLARHQLSDGSWSLSQFGRSHDCRGRCDGEAFLESDTGATSLSLLPFLGAGQTHTTGRYRDVVATGLQWLIQQQQTNGDLRGHSPAMAGMYAHGQSAIVLCEAYALTDDRALKGPAQRAIDFIVASQGPRGGWRYEPGEPGDTSVTGWQWMALQSAVAAQLDVPAETVQRAEHFLDVVAFQGKSRYSYQPHHFPTAAMTAEALLCRMYAGWRPNHAGVRHGVRWLLRHHPPTRDEFNIYYFYYATQVLHHFGGPEWDTWNRQVRTLLIETQEKEGHAAGSWPAVGPHSHNGGRLYVTSLAICTLEVYYRHTPIFRNLTFD